MVQHDDADRSRNEATPGGATGGGGIGSDAVPPESPGNDQRGVVGSGWVWHHHAHGAGERRDDGGDRSDASPPGMMGDGTEEQNLDQPGDPAARITEEEVDAAFAGSKPQAAASDEAAEPQEPVEGRPDR
jgi:hypothetical protein